MRTWALVVICTGLLALATPATGQTASYTVLPGSSPCAGTGGSTSFCASRNGFTTRLVEPVTYRVSNSEVAFAIERTQPSIVSGFEIFSGATTRVVTVNTALYLGNKDGPPLLPAVRTGQMRIDLQQGWYRTTWPPIVLNTGQRFFIAFAADPGIYAPLDRVGIQVGEVWGRDNLAAVWQGPYSGPVLWRLICPGGQHPYVFGIPPVFKHDFPLWVDHALPGAPAACLIGLSTTRWGSLALPFDLSVLGATGCRLFVSIDFVSPRMINQNGYGTFRAYFDDPRLPGVPFYNQWVILDARANAMALVFSDAGRAVIGR